MKIFMKIITLPLKVLFLVVAYIIRAVTGAVGQLVCIISERLAGALRLLAILSDILAIMYTVYAIRGISDGTIGIAVGIAIMLLFWIVAFILDGLWIVGYDLGVIIQNFGIVLTERAIGLFIKTEEEPDDLSEDTEEKTIDLFRKKD